MIYLFTVAFKYTQRLMLSLYAVYFDVNYLGQNQVILVLLVLLGIL